MVTRNLLNRSGAVRDDGAMEIAGWEKLYRSGARGNEDEPTILLRETASRLSPGLAIDLACGTGRNALYLAALGWTVTAVDGSETAIDLLRQRSAERQLCIQTAVTDLSFADFELPPDTFDFIVIAYYLQRDLFPKVKDAVKAGGLILAIAHTPENEQQANDKRVAAGELREYFKGWELLHDYEGPSRDPAHHRPVAEVLVRRPS